jgi:hypothetical protein
MLIALPVAVRLRPVHAVEISAADLLVKVQPSESVAYSGDVESKGSLGLPVSDRFSDVADLLGGRTTMRVWWRGPDQWRVDDLTTTGETDIVADARGTTSWNYEADRAVVTPTSWIRLPRSSDLLPPALAHRLLTETGPDQVVRLGTARIAGIVAPGLRVRPADARSSIDHVDVWADPDSGLPLRVSVYGSGDDVPALTSSFVDVDVATPPVTATSFTRPPGAELRYQAVIDIAGAANRYAELQAPDELLGMRHQDTGSGSVGVYGHGLTQIIAIPLWEPAADPLREQLELTPGSSADAEGTALGVGPLNLRLTHAVFQGHSWLLAGTVTPQTLTAAATELTKQPLFRREPGYELRRP